MKKVQLILSLFIALAMVSCNKDDDKEPTLSSLNEITSFKIDFEGLTDADVEYDYGNEISISVPFNTNLKGLKPVIEVSEKATVSPESGTSIDFEDGVAVPFTVTAEDKTTKVYNVTINVRGEVGSGTKLESVESIIVAWEMVIASRKYEYNDFNFVSKVIFGERIEEFVYDDKNQVIEIKNVTEETTKTYTYEKGLIVSAKEKTNDGKVNKLFNYFYNENNELTKSIETEINDDGSEGKKYTEEFKYTDGNNTWYKNTSETYEAEFDQKNNPFRSIYPKAYTKIIAGNDEFSPNKNNPIKRSNLEFTYEYNNSDYPISSKYFAEGYSSDIKNTYTYYEE